MLLLLRLLLLLFCLQCSFSTEPWQTAAGVQQCLGACSSTALSRAAQHLCSLQWSIRHPDTAACQSAASVRSSQLAG